MLLGDKRVPIDQLLQLDRTLLSVPPVEAYTPMMGKITITIKMEYINLPFERMFEFRYGLWGAEEKVYFLSDKSELKVTASLELLSRYLWDMNILCIEVISAMDSVHQDPNLRISHRTKSPSSHNSPTHEKKVVGYIYISLRKYFINNTMNSFSQQKYPIIDLRKKRIGQMGVEFKIDMLQGNGVKFRQIINADKNNHANHSPQRTQNKYLTVNYNQKQSVLDRPSVANRFSYDELETFERQKAKKVTISDRLHVLSVNNYNSVTELKDNIKQSREKDKSLVDEGYSNKNYFSHSDLNEMESGKMIINEASEMGQNKNTRREYELSIGKRKSSSSKIYLPQKIQQAKHTDLSLIRMKYGSNHPCVQLLKLRLDEAKYLQTHSRQSTTDSEYLVKENTRLNFILKDLTLVSARNFGQTRSLVISHCNKGLKVILKTEINLQALIKNPRQVNSVQLNHVVVLNAVQLTDKILIQTIDSVVQVTIKDLLSGSILDLRRKDNKKRAFQLRYQIGFENQQMGLEEQKRNENIQFGKGTVSRAKVERKQTAGGLKTKQMNNIINKEGDIKKGRSKAKNIKIVPEKENGEIAPQEIMTPYNKLLSKSDVNSQKQSQKEAIDQGKCVVSAFRYFELLYVSENESCFQIVTRLLNEDKLARQEQVLKLSQLESLLTNKRQSDSCDVYSLFIIVDNLFRASFAEFYKCFLSYKEINQRYQTVLYKLKKVLVSPLQDSKPIKREHAYLNKVIGILDYVKKHKKDKVTFGLIKYQDLFQIIKDKLQLEIQQVTFSPKLLKQHEKILTEKSLTVVQRKKQQLQNKSNNTQNHKIFDFIDALLIMFIRYGKDHIKLSQIQSNLEEFVKSKVSSQALEVCELNVNLEFLLNLHRQVQLKDQQKSHQKYTDCYLYHFVEGIKEFVGLNLNKRCEHEIDRMPVYDLLFEDPLSLQELKSSIHYTLFDHVQGRDYQFITEKQDVHNQRFKTEYSKIKGSQQFISKIQRQKTQQQVLKSQRNRLNTEEKNVIDFMNFKKEGFRIESNGSQTISNYNKQVIRREDDEVVGIQITKKEQFLEMEVQHQKQKLQNQEQNHRIENDSLHQHYKTQTKYISIKCSLINPQQLSQIRRVYEEEKNQVVNLFYCHQEIDGGSQEFKIQAKQAGNIAKVIPNSFKLIETQKTSVQEYIFRVETSSLKTKRAQVLKKEIETILKVKNNIGKQRYPIQDSQGKICSIIDIQIEEVDEFEQRMFEEEQERAFVSQKSKEKGSQNFNQMLILNINKLFCLNFFEVGSSLRIIYESSNQIQVLKDVDFFNEDKTLEKLKTGTRVFPINLDFIKLKKGQKGSAQKHLIKIFNVKKRHIQKMVNKLTVNKDKTEINKLKSRTSQPVSRFIDGQEQNSSSDLKNAALDLVCQFQFTLNPDIPMQKSFGVRRQSIWLIDGPYRLQIDLFDARYQKWSQQNSNQIEKNSPNMQKENVWQKKIEKILSVFKIQNQQKIQQEFFQQCKNDQHQPNEIMFEQFMRLVSSIMSYRLTEKEIFASLCFPPIDSQDLSDHQKFEKMCELFNINKGDNEMKKQKRKLQIKNLSALYEEFETFDLEHEGFLSTVKFQVIKKILPQLNQLQIQRFTLHLTKDRQNHLIKDCKASQRENKKSIIDYLKILWQCTKSYEQDFFFEKRVSNKVEIENREGLDVDKKVEVEIKKSDDNKSLPVYYLVGVKKFKNLRLNGIPCTLQFKFNNKQLFEPIYRSYSHQFAQPHFQAIKTQQSLPQTYTLSVFNRLVSLQSKKARQDIYEYKLIEQFDLRRLLAEANQKKEIQTKITFELNCQHLDGSIFIEIECLQSKDQYEYCMKEQARQKIDVDYEVEDEQADVMKKSVIQQSLKPTIEQINPQLKRQFYEEQQSQIEQQPYSKKIFNSKKQKPFEQSAAKALNKSSNKQERYDIEQMLRLERDESLLSQTRKEWQDMLSRNVGQNQQRDIQQVLKKQINKQELNRKFELFKGDGFSDSSDSEIESD